MTLYYVCGGVAIGSSGRVHWGRFHDVDLESTEPRH